MPVNIIRRMIAPIALLLLATGMACEREPKKSTANEWIPVNPGPEEIATLHADCQAGDSYQCWRIAAHLGRAQGKPEEHQAALELARMACGRGYLPACFQAARFFEEGIGVFADPLAALRAYEGACRRRHLEACENQARMLFEGSGRALAADPWRARDLLERTCHHQTLNNCRDIAREVHVRERRLSRGLSEELICSRGWNAACYRLGDLYAAGARDIPVDRERAQIMYDRACNREHAPSCEKSRNLNASSAREAASATKEADSDGKAAAGAESEAAAGAKAKAPARPE